MSTFLENICWSKDTITLADFENHKTDFPIIVKTNMSSSGNDGEVTIEKDHVMLLHCWATQERMHANNDSGISISIPVQHPHKMIVTHKVALDKILRTEPLLPHSIVGTFSPPFTACFDQETVTDFFIDGVNHNTKAFGHMTIGKIHQLKYLVVSKINEDGAIDTETLGAFPVYLNVDLCPALSISDLTLDNFKELLQCYVADSAHLTKNIKHRTFPELANIMGFNEVQKHKREADEITPQQKSIPLLLLQKLRQKTQNKDQPNSYRFLQKKTRGSILPGPTSPGPTSPGPTSPGSTSPIPTKPNINADPGEGSFYFGLSKSLTQETVSEDERIVKRPDAGSPTIIKPKQLEELTLNRPAGSALRESIKPPRPPPPRPLPKGTNTIKPAPPRAQPKGTNPTNPAATDEFQKKMNMAHINVELQQRFKTRNNSIEEKKEENDGLQETTPATTLGIKQQIKKVFSPRTTRASVSELPQKRNDAPKQQSVLPWLRNKSVSEEESQSTIHVTPELPTTEPEATGISDSPVKTPAPPFLKSFTAESGSLVSQSVLSVTPERPDSATDTTITSDSSVQIPVPKSPPETETTPHATPDEPEHIPVINVTDSLSLPTNASARDSKVPLPSVVPTNNTSKSEPSKIKGSIRDWGDVPSDVSDLSQQDVSSCLHLMKLDAFIEKFAENQVDGELLQVLSVDEFREFGMDSFQALKLNLFILDGWRFKSGQQTSNGTEIPINDWEDVPSNISKLSQQQVASCLRLLKLDAFIDTTAERQIDGRLLQELDIDQFKVWGMTAVQAKKFSSFVSKGWRLNSKRNPSMSDPIQK